MCNDKCRDHCGVAAACCSGNAAEIVDRALFHLQHRGQRFVGMGILHEDHGLAGDFASGLVKTNQKLFQSALGGSAIGHVSLKEPQPYFASGKMGAFGLAFNGSILNAQKIRENAKQIGRVLTLRGQLTSQDQVEALAILVGQGEDPLSGLKIMAEQAKGSYSLVLIHHSGVYAMRDPFGFKPLIIGESSDCCAVVSESPAITEIGMQVVRDVKPGEIIFLGKDGFTSVGQIPSARVAHCAFEWAYTARCDSVIDGISVDEVRFNLGANLAKGDRVEADLVAPVPMSGLGHAQGYHWASHIPFRNVFALNRYSDRSYAPLEQEERDIIAAEKLSLLPGAIRGQRIVLCDDSIVRGTQMRYKISLLRQAGAKEIHIRVASPPLRAPCRYGISTRSHDELIARKNSVDEIREKLGADTLQYNSLDDFVRAIGLPREQLCLACFTQEYPL